MTDVHKNGADGLSMAMRAVEFHFRQKKRARHASLVQARTSRRAQHFSDTTHVLVKRWRVVLLAGAVLIPTTSGLYLAGRSLHERQYAPKENGDARTIAAERAPQTERHPEFGDLQPADKPMPIFAPAIPMPPPVAPAIEAPRVVEPEAEKSPDPALSAPPAATSPGAMESAPPSAAATEPDSPAPDATGEAPAPVPAPAQRSAVSRSAPHAGVAGKRRFGQAEARPQAQQPRRAAQKARSAEPRVAPGAVAARAFVLPQALKPSPQ
ncbi:MAG: hypothetical protein JWN07_2027 [Hyphomicrobiales bacterium]|nr:hypothetical protein [Hyphomicrobiales bacterium]